MKNTNSLKTPGQLRAYKKIVDYLYKSGDNCSQFQKDLRMYMLCNWTIWSLQSLKFTAKEMLCKDF